MGSSDPDRGMVFRLQQSLAIEGVGARRGRLAFPGRKPVDTPNFFGITSRGAVPHLTPDVMAKHIPLNGAYIGLEDFLEKSVKRVSPAIINAPAKGSGPLHTYTALPNNVVTVIGARRHPAVVAPMGNGYKYISIFTSTGFQNLDTERYCNAIAAVKPDIAIPLADLTFGATASSAKRQLRMVERTEDWLEELFDILDPEDVLTPSGIHVFAPLLPVPYPIQWDYMNRLSEDYAPRLSGLAVYDVDILADLGQHPPLAPLPRLSMDPPSSPLQIIRQIHLGVDIFTIPFINSSSDSGVAFTFSFLPDPVQTGTIQPLGVDMWSEDHRISLKPLFDGCSCYACTKHHRAYLHHLLNAKEMLGWVLLQVHNHHVITIFFDSIRTSIADGSFDEKADAFAKAYEPDFPLGTGERPRARGYHFKAEANQPKINASTWTTVIDGAGGVDQVLVAEAAGLAVTGGSETAQDAALVSDTNAIDLNEKGFAEIDRTV